MAHIMAKELGWFYPTPEKQLELIKNKLEVEPDKKYALLDPCCGEGVALRVISEHLKATVTYGVEIEEGRAEKARENLDYVVKCDYNQARISPKAFSFIWLNPPYDSIKGERLEVEFLRNLTDPVKGKLMTKGVLGYCIPQRILYQAAPVLAARFDDIAVFKFTEDDFKKFNQIVVFGARREKARRGEEAQAIREWLRKLSESPLPDLSEPKSYILPEASPKIKFKGSPYDQKEVAKELRSSPVWKEVEQTFLPERRVSILQNPVLPLKTAHDAVAIAAGAVGGNMGSHLLVGRAKKVTDKTVTVDEKTEKEKIIESERYITNIKAYTPDGVYDLE